MHDTHTAVAASNVGHDSDRQATWDAFTADFRSSAEIIYDDLEPELNEERAYDLITSLASASGEVVCATTARQLVLSAPPKVLDDALRDAVGTDAVACADIEEVYCRMAEYIFENEVYDAFMTLKEKRRA